MIVVTGAAGFIGSNLAKALAARGKGELVLCDDLKAPGVVKSNSNGPVLRNLPPGMAPAILDRDDLPRWMKGRKDLEALVHLGACSDTTVHDRAFMMEVNFEYSRGLWEVCAEQGIPFLYASSAATYGDGSAGYDDLTPPGDLRPLNVYGESKNLFDQWALSAGRQPPRWAGFKYFNVYGPGEGHKGRMASMAFHAYQQIRQSGRVRLFMSHREGIPHGGQRRDFVYVEDAVEATLHFLGLPVSGQAPNGLYNVGTGEARSFAELAGAVFSALDREPAIEFIPTPEDIRDKYQYFTQAKTGKLRAAGVVRPFHTIEEGVKKYMAFLEPGRPS